MKIKLFLLLWTLFSCHSVEKENGSDKINMNSEQNSVVRSSLLTVDLKHDYPKKRIKLEDMADIEYIPLATSNTVLLNAIGTMAMSGNLIVVCDEGLGTVFFFNRQGKYLNSFKRQGGGPEEYRSILGFCVDFKSEEVYICDYYLNNRVLVYSFKGDFKRHLNLNRKIWPGILYNYDDKHLISYDIYKLDEQTDKKNKYPYALISKDNGKVFPLSMRIDKRVSNAFNFIEDGKGRLSVINIDPMIKMQEGVIISDFAKDIIFSCINGKMAPIAKRNNIASDGNNTCLSTVGINGNRYMILNVIEKEIDRKSQSIVATKSKSLLHDKKMGGIYSAEIFLGDVVNGKGMQWDNYKKDVPDNHLVRVLPASLLLNLLEKNRLQGELKRVASTLDEEDNPVLMIAKFKE